MTLLPRNSVYFLPVPDGHIPSPGSIFQRNDQINILGLSYALYAKQGLYITMPIPLNSIKCLVISGAEAHQRLVADLADFYDVVTDKTMSS